MKKRKLFEAMSQMDDGYIAEAAPLAKRPWKKWTAIGAIAASFCLVLTLLNLWLFLPFDTEPSELSEYADSEYYDVIKKLYAATYRAPTYKNNFDKLMNGIEDGLDNIVSTDKDNASGGADNSVKGDSGASEEYNEVTDNQVDGVIEGDLIKRSDRYIYYLNGGRLLVYSILGEQSALVGSFDIEKTLGASAYAYWGAEMYLSADCKTVTVVMPTYGKTETAFSVIALDVSDPAAIAEKKIVTVTGEYISSRVSGGSLLLLSSFYVGHNPDFSNEASFLPQIDFGNGKESIPAEGILSPDTLTNTRYTVVLKLDENALSYEGAAAFLSYSSEVYVSAENVYATRTYSERSTSNGYVTTRSMTEISCLSYQDALVHRGSVTVEGYLKDRYSLDEYEGILRAVTTTRASRIYEGGGVSNGLSSGADLVGGGTNANLYCIRLSDFQTVGEVIAFAPAGEVVQSVRFEGTTAYVCTAVELSDPVFFFDLSDPAHITYKDTGTVEGFSSSLVDFGDGFLLGIGVGTSRDDVKIEVYEETQTNVTSVAKYELSNADYSKDYKSYYIDRENRFFGFGIFSYSYGHSITRYVLLYFDNYSLHELVYEPISADIYEMRAVYIDGYLYMLGGDAFAVRSVFAE